MRLPISVWLAFLYWSTNLLVYGLVPLFRKLVCITSAARRGGVTTGRLSGGGFTTVVAMMSEFESLWIP